MGSIYVICSRQCPNGDGIYTLLYALYKYSTSITNQPTNISARPQGWLSVYANAGYINDYINKAFYVSQGLGVIWYKVSIHK